MKREIKAFFWLTFVIHSCIGTTTDPGTSYSEKGHEVTVGKNEGAITVFIAAILILLICIRYYLKSNKNHRPTSENQPFLRSSQATKGMKLQITCLLYITFAILLGLGTEMDVATANDEKGHEATAGNNIVNIVFLIVIIIPSVQGNILFNFRHCVKQKENHRKVSEEGSFEQSSSRNDAEEFERMKLQITAFLHFTFAILLRLGTEMDVATANDEKGHEATAGKNIANIIFLIVIIIPSVQGNILFNLHHYAKLKENHRKVSEEGSFEESSSRNDAEGTNREITAALSFLNLLTILSSLSITNWKVKLVHFEYMW